MHRPGLGRLGSPPVATPFRLSFTQKLTVQSSTDAFITPEKPFGVAPFDSASPAPHFHVFRQGLQQPAGFLADDSALAHEKLDPSVRITDHFGGDHAVAGIHGAAPQALPLFPYGFFPPDDVPLHHSPPPRNPLLHPLYFPYVSPEIYTYTCTVSRCSDITTMDAVGYEHRNRT